MMQKRQEFLTHGALVPNEMYAFAQAAINSNPVTRLIGDSRFLTEVIFLDLYLTCGCHEKVTRGDNNGGNRI